MEAMGASATLFSIVNRTSTATAKQPWHMHRKKAGASCDFDAGGPNECTATGVELVETHPALTVLNKPNPFFTRQELVESGQLRFERQDVAEDIKLVVPMAWDQQPGDVVADIEQAMAESLASKLVGKVLVRP